MLILGSQTGHEDPDAETGDVFLHNVTLQLSQIHFFSIPPTNVTQHAGHGFQDWDQVVQIWDC